jgi:hypothetical protein
LWCCNGDDVTGRGIGGAVMGVLPGRIGAPVTTTGGGGTTFVPQPARREPLEDLRHLAGQDVGDVPTSQLLWRADEDGVARLVGQDGLDLK